MSRTRPWYDSYELLREEVNLLRKTFHERCKQLKQKPRVILNAFSRDIISRAVFESNWQEGIEVERGRTKELADIVFEDFDHLDIPHLDFAGILNHHRSQVIALRRKRVSQDELAAYNLSVAHRCLWWILNELLERQVAFLSVAIKNVEAQFAQTKTSMSEQVRLALQKGLDVISAKLEDRTTLHAPFAGTFKTSADLFKKYLECDFQMLTLPLPSPYG
jgi:hypothetical protein